MTRKLSKSAQQSQGRPTQLLLLRDRLNGFEDALALDNQSLIGIAHGVKTIQGHALVLRLCRKLLLKAFQIGGRPFPDYRSLAGLDRALVAVDESALLIDKISPIAAVTRPASARNATSRMAKVRANSVVRHADDAW
jgi:hypothetical protein